MKRDFKKGDLAILIDVYALCLEYDMERYIETSEWHEALCVVLQDPAETEGGYKILTSKGVIEYANKIFLFDPVEYSSSTYHELYDIAMKERSMNEKVRWRKHSENKNEGNHGQTPLS